VVPFKQRSAASPLQSQAASPSVRSAPPQAPSGTYSPHPAALQQPAQPPPPRPSQPPAAGPPPQRGSPQQARPQLTGTSRFPKAGQDGPHPIYQQRHKAHELNSADVRSTAYTVHSYGVRENAGGAVTDATKGGAAQPGAPGAGSGQGAGAGQVPGGVPGTVPGTVPPDQARLRDNYYKSYLAQIGGNRVPIPKPMEEDAFRAISRSWVSTHLLKVAIFYLLYALG